MSQFFGFARLKLKSQAVPAMTAMHQPGLKVWYEGANGMKREMIVFALRLDGSVMLSNSSLAKHGGIKSSNAYQTSKKFFPE